MSNEATRTTASSAGSTAAVEQVSQILFSRIDAEDAAPIDAATRLKLGEATLANLSRRDHGRASIRIEPLGSVGLAGTLIEVINDDMPFLLDSLLAELGERGLAIALVAHPILAVEREPSGKLARLLGASSARELPPVQRESLLHIHISVALDEAQRADLGESLTRIFSDIRAAVSDWMPMRTRLAEVATRYRATPPMLPA